MNARTEAAHRVLVVHAQCVVVEAELRLYDIGELPAQARCVFDPQRAILVRQMHQCPFPYLFSTCSTIQFKITSATSRLILRRMNI